MSLGLSRIDGVFASVSDMQASKASNNRKLAVITAGDPITTQEYWTEATDRGGVLLASGNYANPINAVGAGEVNTTSNSGAGAGLALPKSGTDLPFKSVVGGTNVTITEEAETITINASGGGGSTNLGYTASPTNGTVTSDTGTDATIPSADEANAGLFLPAEKTKLSGIGAGAQLVSVQAGTNVTVDNTDPQNPIISATGGGSGGKSLPYTLSGTGFEIIGTAGRTPTRIFFYVPVSLSATPSSATMSGTVTSTFFRNDTNNTGQQNFNLAADVTYNAADSTPDMLSFTATVANAGFTAWGQVTGAGSAWSIQLNA